LLICLLSGGASALVAAPAPGIGLDDLQALTSSLLASGADIEEINTVRRQVDLLKGGGLACSTRAAIVSLILSDVIGDRLEDIASGPTAPDPTTHARARSILRKYRIQAPEAINYALHLTELSRTTSRFDRVQNIIVGNNQMAVAAARSQAAAEGFAAETLAAALRGEAREVGQGLSNSLREALHTRPHPFCLIAGGETTVTLSGNGKGGRNQELALSAVDGLAGIANAVLVCCATDGNDGPTDAAGAVVTGETRQRGRQLGMQAADYLSRHDAYPFFDALGDLLRPGYTGTNVNDLLLCFGL
jgi:hydroxypyruvate reductase